MTGSPRRLRSTLLHAAALLAAVALALGGSPGDANSGTRPEDPRLTIPDSLRGRSGRLKARIVRPVEAEADSTLAPRIPPETQRIVELFGLDAARGASLLAVRDSVTDEPFYFITLLPFAEKRAGRIGAYRVGRWPAEVRTPLSDAYRVPAGFVAVTEENQDLLVSTNFRLRDFLSRDQADVWPKPLVLDERLVDKLELVLAELRAAGHARARFTILSGFRTPRVNARGANSSQSTESRHQYGDAADLIVDGNGDGRMDDLDRSGAVDERDALVLLRLIDRVERRYPDLAGGAGLYRGTVAQGPFVHLDARGKRARWGLP
jgi:hypothetical protein